MRVLICLLTALCANTAWADAPATASATPAPAAASAAQLGKVEVQGQRPLVEVLQQMKTAIDAPFSNDPRHYDDMVCRLEENSGFRAQGVLLECGTQGWFNMQRSIYHRDMDVGADSNLAGTPTLGHPWHIVRLLDHEQLAALRKVLGTLLPPGKGDIQVVDDQGQSRPK